MPAIVATLLTTEQPQPVQVLVTDVDAGVAYTVTGVTLSGRRWTLPGGESVSDGEQIRLVDDRGPVNSVVQYELSVEGVTYTSNQVSIPWAPADGDSPRYLIQSLDGRLLVPIRQWHDNGLPWAPEVRSAKFAVRGRRKPVVVTQPAAMGDTQAQVMLSRSASEQLAEILYQGGSVVVRTTGNERDLKPSDLAVIMSASSTLFPNDGQSTSRLWDLTLTWVDDPEPSTIPTVYTVDDVDTLLGVALGLTVDQVDALFAGLSVDDVDAMDWGSVE